MNENSDSPVSDDRDSSKSPSSNLKGQIGIGLLVLYVFLLALGTIGEIWEVEWILDLPLFRPPGKY